MTYSSIIHVANKITDLVNFIEGHVYESDVGYFTDLHYDDNNLNDFIKYIQQYGQLGNFIELFIYDTNLNILSTHSYGKDFYLKHLHDLTCPTCHNSLNLSKLFL